MVVGFGLLVSCVLWIILLWVWCLDRKYKIVIVFFYQKAFSPIVENFFVNGTPLSYLTTLTISTTLSKRMDSIKSKVKIHSAVDRSWRGNQLEQVYITIDICYFTLTFPL